MTVIRSGTQARARPHNDRDQSLSIIKAHSLRDSATEQIHIHDGHIFSQFIAHVSKVPFTAFEQIITRLFFQLPRIHANAGVDAQFLKAHVSFVVKFAQRIRRKISCIGDVI
jgi:hypothetical protein